MKRLIQIQAQRDPRVAPSRLGGGENNEYTGDVLTRGDPRNRTGSKASDPKKVSVSSEEYFGVFDEKKDGYLYTQDTIEGSQASLRQLLEQAPRPEESQSDFLARLAQLNTSGDAPTKSKNRRSLADILDSRGNIVPIEIDWKAKTKTTAMGQKEITGFDIIPSALEKYFSIDSKGKWSIKKDPFADPAVLNKLLSDLGLPYAHDASISHTEKARRFKLGILLFLHKDYVDNTLQHDMQRRIFTDQLFEVNTGDLTRMMNYATAKKPSELSGGGPARAPHESKWIKPTYALLKLDVKGIDSKDLKDLKEKTKKEFEKNLAGAGEEWAWLEVEKWQGRSLQAYADFYDVGGSSEDAATRIANALEPKEGEDRHYQYPNGRADVERILDHDPESGLTASEFEELSARLVSQQAARDQLQSNQARLEVARTNYNAAYTSVESHLDKISDLTRDLYAQFPEDMTATIADYTPADGGSFDAEGFNDSVSALRKLVYKQDPRSQNWGIANSSTVKEPKTFSQVQLLIDLALSNAGEAAQFYDEKIDQLKAMDPAGKLTPEESDTVEQMDLIDDVADLTTERDQANLNINSLQQALKLQGRLELLGSKGKGVGHARYDKAAQELRQILTGLISQDLLTSAQVDAIIERAPVTIDAPVPKEDIKASLAKRGFSSDHIALIMAGKNIPLRRPEYSHTERMAILENQGFKDDEIEAILYGDVSDIDFTGPNYKTDLKSRVDSPQCDLFLQAGSNPREFNTLIPQMPAEEIDAYFKEKGIHLAENQLGDIAMGKVVNFSQAARLTNEELRDFKSKMGFDDAKKVPQTETAPATPTTASPTTPVAAPGVRNLRTPDTEPGHIPSAVEQLFDGSLGTLGIRPQATGADPGGSSPTPTTSSTPPAGAPSMHSPTPTPPSSTSTSTSSSDAAGAKAYHEDGIVVPDLLESLLLRETRRAKRADKEILAKQSRRQKLEESTSFDGGVDRLKTYIDNRRQTEIDLAAAFENGDIDTIKRIYKKHGLEFNDDVVTTKGWEAFSNLIEKKEEAEEKAKPRQIEKLLEKTKPIKDMVSTVEKFGQSMKNFGQLFKRNKKEKAKPDDSLLNSMINGKGSNQGTQGLDLMSKSTQKGDDLLKAMGGGQNGKAGPAEFIKSDDDKKGNNGSNSDKSLMDQVQERFNTWRGGQGQGMGGQGGGRGQPNRNSRVQGLLDRLSR